MTELEVIRDAEIVQESEQDILEACISEWTTGAAQAIWGQLRQARAASIYVEQRRKQGLTAKDAIEEFGSSVGAKKSKVYNYIRVYTIYGHILEDTHSMLSSRVESGMVSMSELVEKTYAKDPIEAAETPSSVSEAKAQNQIEKVEEQAEKSENVRQMRACEACGGSGEVPVD